MKHVVVVAGGVWQEQLVRFLKSQGYCILIVNPVVTRVVELCDHHILTDIKDIDCICRYLESSGIEPEFIISDESDVAVMPVAQLSERLGLVGNDLGVLEHFTNKASMYEFAVGLGLPVITFRKATTQADVEAFGCEVGYPIITKPLDSTNSRGFHIIRTPSELAEAVASSLKHSMVGSIVTQRYEPGKLQLTVEGICSGGVHRTIAASYKTSFLSPGLSTFIRWPFEDPIMEAIVLHNDRFVDHSGLQFGLTHSEYIVDGDRFWFNEIAARGGGYRISSDIVPWVTGVDTHAFLVENLRGNTIDLNALKVERKPAIIKFYSRDQLVQVDREQLLECEGVIDYNDEYMKHLYVQDSNNRRDAYAIICAESNQELDARVAKMESLCLKS